MSKVRATPEELQQQIDALTAEADALQTKGDLTPEEQTHLEDLVTQIEQLQADLAAAQTAARFVAAKERMAAPTRPAPRLIPAQYKRSEPNMSEALGLWLRSRTPDADLSPAAANRAAACGFDLGRNAIRVPVNYRNLNVKNRTIMSKGGAASGLELVYQTFSDKVTEYLSYASPLVSLLGSETTSDGNARTYFKIDDTSMESTYTSASGGTETVPTIPDVNIATANIVINCFDITSGYQKVSFNELRDSYVSLEDKIARANSNSHARKIEREVVTATGNGSTGVEGLGQVVTAITDAASWTSHDLERLYFSVPAQYRNNCIFMSNGDAYGDIYSALKNDVGDSLFGKTVDQGIEYDVLLGKKFIQSDYMPDNTVYFFAPEFYMLRLVEGQIFQSFTEKFWPNAAWAGLMTFGGAWIGPSSACKSLSADTGSSS